MSINGLQGLQESGMMLQWHLGMHWLLFLQPVNINSWVHTLYK